MKSVSHIILAALMSAGVAFANEGNPAQQSDNAMKNTQGQQQGQQDFRKADSNKDGRVSQSEARDGQFDYIVVNFEPLDEDGNGYLDENEWDLNETGAGMYDQQNMNRSVSTTGSTNNTGSSNNNYDYYDANDDGFLDEDEVSDDDYVTSNFDTWDENDDGYLEAGEADDDWLDWDEESFDAYDVNDDGMLDEDEAAGSDYLDSNFDTWDVNTDGYLDGSEVLDTRDDDEGFNE